MLESIGSVLSKEELRVVIGGDKLEDKATTIQDSIDDEIKFGPCAGKELGEECFHRGYKGVCHHKPFSGMVLFCVKKW